MKKFEELPQENIKLIGDQISNKLYGFFDPITILMIIGVAINVIKIIYECRKKNKLTNFLLKKNSLIAKIFIKKNIYDQLIAKGMNADQANLACEKLKDFYQEEDWDQHLKPLYQ